MRKIQYLRLPNGREPFREWFKCLDLITQTKIQLYLDRIVLGGGKKILSQVFEVKINFGPGFRVYFAEEGRFLLLLLLGGDKGTQTRDIERAKTYWKEYVQK